MHLHEPVAGHLDLARGVGQRVEHIGTLGLDGVALVEHDVRARREIAQHVAQTVAHGAVFDRRAAKQVELVELGIALHAVLRHVEQPVHRLDERVLAAALAADEAQVHAREPVGKAARERAEAVRLHIAHRRIGHQLGVFRQGEHLREHAQDDRLRHRLLEQILGARSQRFRGRAAARGRAVDGRAHRAAERVAAAVFGEKAPDVRCAAVARLARGIAQGRDPRPHGRGAQQRRERLRGRCHDADARKRVARRRFGQAAHGQRLALDAAEHDLRPRMALLRAERAQEVELHRCFQIAAAADGGLKLPGKMHIGFRLSQLPRVAPQGKPLALPW